MDAMKCDRCGKFYLPDNNSTQCNAIQKYKKFGGICGDDKTYDICPECMKSFERWVSHEN